MKRLKLTVYLLLLPTFIYSQTDQLPYPIIFVHGSVGSDKTFIGTMNYLNTEIGIGPINVFDVVLNADNDKSSSILSEDVKWNDWIFNGNYINVGRRNYADNPDDFTDTWIGQSSRIFAINFAEERIRGASGFNDLFDGSNQAAIYKQAYALSIMINEVIEFTGAEKVILVGHSMGGLAIREYLQRTDELGNKRWYSGNNHRVAKVITIGTPHLGSNSGFDPTQTESITPDQNSEAMRDLKYSYDGYPGCSLLEPVGLYLFGGNEFCLLDNEGNTPFWNADINCDGDEDDMISGLNQYNTTLINSNMPLPDNILYTWITSNVNMGENAFNLLLCTTGPIAGDACVLLDRQWIYNEESEPLPFQISDTLLTTKTHAMNGCGYGIEGSDYYSILRGLDEPNTSDLAYVLNSTNPSYFISSVQGFITYQTNYAVKDTDYYKFTIDIGGSLVLSGANINFDNGNNDTPK